MSNLKNKCFFEGRTYDLKESDVQINGQQVKKVMFKLIVPRSLTKEQRAAAQNNNSIQTSDFVAMSAIGKTAEFIVNWCKEGTAINVECTYTTYLKINQQTGQKEYGSIFNVNEVDFVSTSKDNSNNNNGGNNNYSNNRSQQNNSQPSNGGFQMFDNSASDDSQPW